jgi:hypothetical protein
MAVSPTQEFCIKLSMSTIEGRPLSVTLARFHESDNPLIGCSMGFLKLTGLQRNEVIGRNCRFLNLGVDMPSDTRERLHHTMRTGTPFLGVLNNRRYLGNGCWETFENMLHMVVVFAGTRSYILGIQVDVTGLNLDLADGSQDAARLQMMFDSVLAAQADSWIHFHEGDQHSAPLYLYIRHAGDASIDEVEVVEGEGPEYEQWAEMQQVPDQYLVLAPQFTPMSLPNEDKKWSFYFNEEAGPDKTSLSPRAPVSRRSPSRTPTPERNWDPAEETRKTSNESRQTTAESTTEQPGKWHMYGSQDGYGSQIVPTSIKELQGVSSTDLNLPHNSTLAATLEQASAELCVDSMGTPTMKTQLQALDLEDPMTVLIARGVSKLGINAGDALRDYFSSYGVVKAVHIPYTFKKRKRSHHAEGAGGGGGGGRETRAPGRCFIVMSTSQERNEILENAGHEHLVQNVKVTLEPFAAKLNEAIDE